MNIEFNTNLLSQKMYAKKVKFGLTQQDMADQLPLSISAVNRIINEYNIPDLISFFKMCRWMNEPMEQFFIVK